MVRVPMRFLTGTGETRGESSIKAGHKEVRPHGAGGPCVYPVVYPTRRRNPPARARAIQRDSRKLPGKCGWARTSPRMAQAYQARGRGFKSRRPRHPTSAKARPGVDSAPGPPRAAPQAGLFWGGSSVEATRRTAPCWPSMCGKWACQTPTHSVTGHEPGRSPRCKTAAMDHRRAGHSTGGLCEAPPDI